MNFKKLKWNDAQKIFESRGVVFMLEKVKAVFFAVLLVGVVSSSSAIGFAEDVILVSDPSVIKGETILGAYENIDKYSYTSAYYLSQIEKVLRNYYPLLQREAFVLGKERQLFIEEREGQYYWRSNKNKKLKKSVEQIAIFPMEVKGISSFSKENTETLAGGKLLTVTVFETVDTNSLLIILHLPPQMLERACPQHDFDKCDKYGCFRWGINYFEYHLQTNGGVQAHAGQTAPFPYPVADVCEPHEECPEGEVCATLKQVDFGNKTNAEE